MSFNYRARGGHDRYRRGKSILLFVSTTVPAEGTTGITVLYGNTNIFFPILREVCDLRIYMVLCL